ncbi:MAG: restriction endonuclease subunit S [Verrucomicrobiota bacterium]
MNSQWETKQLGDVCEFQRGLTYAKSDEVDFSNNVVLRATNIDLATNLIDFSELKYINEKVAIPDAKKVKKDSLLICTASGSKSHLGKVALIDDDHDWAFGGFMGLLTPKNGVLPRYLFHLMTSNDYKDFINGLSDGANINNLKFDDLKQFRVPHPPLPEQQRIVALLDEAMAGIATARANAEANRQNARAVFASYLQAVFTQRGEGWVDRPLKELCIVDWGNTKLTKSSYIEGGRFLAVSAAGCDGRIGHKEHSLHTPVLSAIGAQCGRMFLPDEDFTAIKNTITLTPRDGVCTGKFLYRLLTHVDLPKRGAAQPFISKGDIQAFQVVVPACLSVQKMTEEAVSELEIETQRLESLYTRKLAALDELKKSLLHQAFSGKL